jgi:SAM-dependent methyltransferase
MPEYVHGYSEAEESRLSSQANILVPFIHGTARYAPGSRVLEPGCGTGAQTVQLAANNAGCEIFCVDRSPQSLESARRRVASRGLANARFEVADICELPFPDAHFDGLFLCFVLEHLPERARALAELRRVLKPGAKVHAFEGDHASVLAWPEDPAIGQLVAAVSEYQRMQGGDVCMGRGLGPILAAAGFRDVAVEPCVAYADAARPEWVQQFTRATFIDMMRPQRAAVLSNGLLDEPAWDRGMRALERTTAADGSFSYTFYRAAAIR